MSSGFLRALTACFFVTFAGASLASAEVAPPLAPLPWEFPVPADYEAYTECMHEADEDFEDCIDSGEEPDICEALRVGDQLDCEKILSGE